jgi:hypothetical protein
MAAKNFFKLNLIHPVIIRFVNDHNITSNCFQESLAFINSMGEFPAEHIITSESEQIITYYQNLSKFNSELQDTHLNFIISYYAFRELAQTNKEVQIEFNKLPPDFMFIQNFFQDLSNQYTVAINAIKNQI